uniref:Amine oxidase n=1 Tax=Ananas comosus var. bracteatus TaxID=296719 RepID=A0A6V7QKD9_ANACO|nr:unnamed protein product [Ananas comosus var. bracteatus]
MVLMEHSRAPSSASSSSSSPPSSSSSSFSPTPTSTSPPPPPTSPPPLNPPPIITKRTFPTTPRPPHHPRALPRPLHPPLHPSLLLLLLLLASLHPLPLPPRAPQAPRPLMAPGRPLPPRRALAVLRFRSAPYVVSVDLSGATVSHLPFNSSGFPAMTIEDMTSSTWAPLADPEFNRTVLARGVRLSDLACLPISPGWFGPDEEGRRVIKIQCYSADGTANFYMRPIEGLTVLLDLDTKEVLRISDRGSAIPIPAAANTDYRYDSRTAQTKKNKRVRPVNPMSMEQPAGPSFEVENGHQVKWAGWDFHIKADARAGIVVSGVGIVDPESGERREVMYKGMASELFVPYMDPSEAWYFKTYMDAGEYGFGLQAMPLVPLNDCPRNAYYLDGVFATADGRPTSGRT